MKKYKCKCGGIIEQGRCLVEDFLVSCMKCNKCEERLFTPDQTKELIRLRDANKVVEGERKIIKVGSSIAALLPKKINNYGIEAGLIDTVRILSKNSLEIQFKKEIVK
ncbi:hypothetical protein HZA97_04860 [Candidatus Woesearchaeota archaeon]|nr:hypothetical protein [Candidatus Woesearchaeota archaeon]